MNKGIFLIHGLLGGKGELNSLIKNLNKGGYFVYAPKISGQAKTTTFFSWLEQIKNHYVEFSKKVDSIIIIGYSMGGILASYLASSPIGDSLKGIVFINAAFKHAYFDDYGSIKRLFFEGLSGIKRGINLDFQTYDIVKQVKELKKLSDLSKKEEWLRKVNQPTLIIQGTKDGFVIPDTAKYIYNTVSSRIRQTRYYNTKHAFWASDDFNNICRDIIIFIKGIE